MDEQTPHPDDATLFDLIEGTLEESRAQEIERHLDACPECGAIVRASLAGSPDEVTPVEQMPEAASVRMHQALAEGWRERVAAIAQAEAEADARVTHVMPQAPELAPDDLLARPQELYAPAAVDQPAGRPRSRRDRWSRRLVPALAFVVLGALAGTSYYIGQDDGGVPTTSEVREADDSASEDAAGGSSESSEVPQIDDGADEAVTAPDTTTGTATDMSSEPAVAPTEDRDAAKRAEAAAEASPPPVVEPADGDGRTVPLDEVERDSSAEDGPPEGVEEFIGGDTVCMITFDETSLLLPDDRVPQQVQRGPFGLILVCG